MYKKILYTSIFLIMITSLNANAQTPSHGITANTNKSVYQPGDKVIITGSVEQVVDGFPVAIIVRSPINNVYDIGQVNLLNNVFVHDFVISSNSNAGTYTINIKHGNQTAQLEFIVSVEPALNIPVDSNFIKVIGNDTSLISYKNVQVSTKDKFITIDLVINSVTNTPIKQEFQIPKQVIDAAGGSLIIQVNGNNILCTQSETDSDRILDCIIPLGAKQLKLIGTSVIPEFGSATMVVLISIISAVIFFTKIKLR